MRAYLGLTDTLEAIKAIGSMPVNLLYKPRSSIQGGNSFLSIGIAKERQNAAAADDLSNSTNSCRPSVTLTCWDAGCN